MENILQHPFDFYLFIYLFFFRITRWFLESLSWQLPLVFKILNVQDCHRVIAVITGFILLSMATEPCPND